MCHFGVWYGVNPKIRSDHTELGNLLYLWPWLRTWFSYCYARELNKNIVGCLFVGWDCSDYILRPHSFEESVSVSIFSGTAANGTAKLPEPPGTGWIDPSLLLKGVFQVRNDLKLPGDGKWVSSLLECFPPTRVVVGFWSKCGIKVFTLRTKWNVSLLTQLQLHHYNLHVSCNVCTQA